MLVYSATRVFFFIALAALFTLAPYWRGPSRCRVPLLWGCVAGRRLAPAAPEPPFWMPLNHLPSRYARHGPPFSSLSRRRHGGSSRPSASAVAAPVCRFLRAIRDRAPFAGMTPARSQVGDHFLGRRSRPSFLRSVREATRNRCKFPAASPADPGGNLPIDMRTVRLIRLAIFAARRRSGRLPFASAGLRVGFDAVSCLARILSFRALVIAADTMLGGFAEDLSSA